MFYDLKRKLEKKRSIDEQLLKAPKNELDLWLRGKQKSAPFNYSLAPGARMGGVAVTQWQGVLVGKKPYFAGNDI